MNQGWQSEATDGPTGAWGLLSFSLFLSLARIAYLPTYLPIYLSVYLSNPIQSNPIQSNPILSYYLSIYLSISISLSIYLSIYRSQLPKVVRTPGVLYILTWKCASRHNGVHFIDISTSKSGPRPPVFRTFDFKMCFAPQRRALFQHLDFQKWSEALVLCAFWLRNVLRATTACTFSTSQLPKVVRDRQFLTLLTSKCASRHNGVQFFIAPVASWLRTRRFSEPTFRPSGATNHWKNTVFRDFPTFSRICIFCLLTLSLLIFSLLIFLFSLPLPCSAFHLSILSEVWLLNFLRSDTHHPCSCRLWARTTLQGKSTSLFWRRRNNSFKEQNRKPGRFRHNFNNDHAVSSRKISKNTTWDLCPHQPTIQFRLSSDHWKLLRHGRVKWCEVCWHRMPVTFCYHCEHPKNRFDLCYYACKSL